MNENKFDGKGKIYARFRPAYPKAWIDYLYSDAGFTSQSVIADIGSGTGILAKQLLERGNRVYAVEPNDDMREIAENDLREFKNFISVKAAAENTGLDGGSVDRITAAQAFHWFDRQKFKMECKRILAPGGIVVLVWNSRDAKSRLVMENDRINRKYCPKFNGFSGGMLGAESEDEFSVFFSGGYDRRVFQNDLTFDEQSFIGRNLSASYAPKETDSHYCGYIAELKALFAQYGKNGVLVMPNWTRSYAGRV